MKEFERSDLGSNWDGMNESIGWRVARVEPLLGSQKLEGGPEELTTCMDFTVSSLLIGWVNSLRTTSKCFAPQ